MKKTLKYQKIIDFVKEQIGNGSWPVGSKLPSQREFARQFCVNRSTVITAFEELAADGLIQGMPGKGTVVLNNTWTLMRSDPPVNWNEHVPLGAHQASQSTVQAINLAESDRELIQLSKGELSQQMFPLYEMREVIQKVGEGLLPFGYEDPKGLPALRQAISNYLLEKEIQAPPSSILIVSGALQGLHLISIGLLKRGSTVYLEDPSYLYSLSTFQSAGMKLQGIRMDEGGIVPEQIEKAGSGNQSVLYCHPTYQNPTGILMGTRRRRDLLALVEKGRLPIIEDDVYGDLWIDSPPPPPIKSFDKHGNVLYLGSLSKSLSPGLRIGWLVGPESVIDRLADLKMQTDYGSSSLSQRVAAEWLNSGLYKAHLMGVRKQLKERKEVVLSVLKQHLGKYAEWDVPEGGFFIWIKMNPDIPIDELHSRALKKGVLLNPGRIYSTQKQQSFRLSYVNASLEDLVKGITILESIIKDW